MRSGSFVLSLASALLLVACGGNVVTGPAGSGGTSSSGPTTTTGPGPTTATGPGPTTATGPGSTAATGPGSTTTTTTSSGGTCGPCQMGFICCNGTCVNGLNDIDNCGSCGTTCPGPSPYCHDGVCGTPPCTNFQCPNGESCCGNECCSAGQLCCDQYGPIGTSTPMCTTPENGTCPAGCTACKCASPDTPVATPTGERHIADLAVGDLVYSVDHGAVVAVPVLRTNRTPVHDHHVVRVTLATGAVLEISPRHPTADGRTFGDLHAGGVLDHIPVTAVELVPYEHPFTYDILPASETHAYYAAGALIGTTLAP